MPNPYFAFKKFTVFHDKCAMKVGTDGCLLGAWADAEKPEHILDIGAGSGLIALMLAQRFEHAHLTALEIESNCAKQCAENIKKSPFASRISTLNQSLQTYKPDHTFDLIVSNPPYFTQGFLPDNVERKTARHDAELSVQELFYFATHLLSPNGRFCLVLPTSRETDFISAAAENNLYLQEKTYVKPTPTKEAKRVLLSFARENSAPKTNEILVEITRAVYSEEFRKLLTDFYLYL